MHEVACQQHTVWNTAGSPSTEKKKSRQNYVEEGTDVITTYRLIVPHTASILAASFVMAHIASSIYTFFA